MLENFKRKFDIKKQAVSPVRKPPRLGSAKMKAAAKLSRKKSK